MRLSVDPNPRTRGGSFLLAVAVLVLLAGALLAQDETLTTAAVDTAPPPEREAGALGVQEEAALGTPAGAPRKGRELEQAADTVSSDMRCPVCQGLSIADSPSDMARDMRGKVRTLLAEGYSPEQVMQYFENTYGEFVRLQPKPQGFNLVVWIAPVAVLLIGLALTAYVLKSRTTEESADAAAGEPELETLRERVRREAGC